MEVIGPQQHHGRHTDIVKQYPVKEEDVDSIKRGGMFIVLIIMEIAYGMKKGNIGNII